jgi:hypothetical protein
MGPAGQEPTGRIRTEVPDASRAVAQISGQVEKLGGQVVDYFQKAEDDQVDLTSRVAASEYEQKKKAAMRQAQMFEGDPNEVYQKLRENRDAWENEVNEKYSNVSERTKQAIKERILGVDRTIDDQIAMNYETQLHAWDKKNTDAEIASKKENASWAAETVNINDDASFNRLRVAINEIKDARYKSGTRRGLVSKQVDAEGNAIEESAPSLRYEIKKDASEAIENVVRILHASGKMDEAQKIMDEFKDDILADAKSKLLKHKDEKTIFHKAAVEIQKVRGLDPKKALEHFDRIKDLEVQEKARAMYHTRQVQQEKITEVTTKRAFEEVNDHLRDLEKKNRPIRTVDQFRNDPFVSKMMEKDLLTTKQIRDLEKHIEKPEQSNEKVLNNAYEAMFDAQSFANLSYGEMKSLTAGLSEKDANYFEKRWADARSETPSEQSKMITYMGKQLQEQLFEAKKLKKEYGRWTDKSERFRIQEYGEMLKAIETFPPGMSQIEQSKWVKEFVSKRLAGEVFTGLARKPQKFESKPEPKATPKPVEDASSRKLEPDEKRKVMEMFYKENGRSFNPKTDKVSDLQKYIKDIQ